jgi:hypothetical protein
MLPDVEALTEKVHQSLRLWRMDRLDASPLSDLLEVAQLQRQGLTAARATHEVLMSAIATLETYRPEQARLLRGRFYEGLTMQQVARTLPWSIGTLYTHQKEAIGELARTLLRREQQFYASRLAQVDQGLIPQSTTPLVGAENKLAALHPLLETPHAPWLIALTGEGGIGKTRLAEALGRAIVLKGSADRLVWISAKQEMLSVAGRLMPLSDAPLLSPETLLTTLAERLLISPDEGGPRPAYEQIDRIKAHLRQVPYLLILDNLETVPNLERLVPLLRRLVQPTKILLTSRVRLPDEGDIYDYAVPPLSQTEAHQLLRQEAQIRNISALAECDTHTAGRIYAVVGGNPLALGIVAGQAGLYGVERVLYDLRHATGSGDPLYRFLYAWSWEHLSDLCRRILVAMVMAPAEGCTLDWLADLTRLETPDLRMAVEALVTQHLLQVSLHSVAIRYSLHNLTRTFLQEAVLRW